MDIQKIWEKALRNTEILRSRIQMLSTYADTHVPYILLSESEVNLGDTVVRKGEVLVQKPSIILPPSTPQFKGFEFQEEERMNEESLINFLLVRGVSFPSLRYDNRTYTLDVYDGKMSSATKHYLELLQKQEDVRTGLLRSREDCWQFSILIFIYTQVIKNANIDIKKLLDDLS